ncbi:MAG: cyclic nucleotide-binding domain-containing protein [Clostridia bacterium]|nr:cyclic nucleotide-binding domain-containing protein [Clostridia bacterium]
MKALNREYRTYRKGEVIFKQGDPADCMYDIRWGSVGIYVGYGTEQEKLLAQRRGDEVIGEMSFVDEVPHSVTAVALEPETRAEIITKETFSYYLHERPERVVDFIQNMCRRIRDITNDYIEARRALSEAEKLRQSEEGEV